uniref:Prolyl endopeptidase-like n=1 Tax=Rhizophora mucronata TaxID=61149 RepID=A0A2P2KHY7_RHIMU
MALPFLLKAKTRLKTPILPLASSTIFSSFYCISSRCRRDAAMNLCLPSQPPPVAKKVPSTVSAHGRTLQDPYHWMRNTADPSFVEYVNQENAYAEAFMADTQHLQRTLFEEMRSRIPTKISTPPERWGPWLYYEYIPEGKAYPILCRKLDTKINGWMKTFLSSITGKFGREQHLLDWNEIAEQNGYVHVGSCRVSPDHNFLAYTLDTTGHEEFILQIKDLRNGSIVPRSHVDGVISLAWAQDSSTLFYTISDDNQRPYRVLCTKMGSDEIHNYPIFTESDSSYCVDITSTKDGKFITVNSNSRTSSEVYVIDATSPFHGMQRVRKRVSGVQYFLEHHSGMFYILTNAPLSENKIWSGGNYYLATCQVEHIQSSNWQNILPGEDVSFQDIDILHGHLVLFLNKKDIPMLCSINLPIKASVKVVNVNFFALTHHQ